MITKPKKFVVFEGMDCAGKSSIIKMLQSYIEKLDNKEQYIFTREPGSSNSKEAEKIRTLILDKENEFSPTSDALLFLAARRIRAAALATSPVPIILTGGLMKRIISKIAKPEYTLPPGESMYM